MTHVETHAAGSRRAVAVVAHVLFISCVGIALAVGLAVIAALSSSTAAGADDVAPPPVPARPTDAPVPGNVDVVPVLPAVAQTAEPAIQVVENAAPAASDVTPPAEPVTPSPEDIVAPVVETVATAAERVTRTVEDAADPETVTAAVERAARTLEDTAAAVVETGAPAAEAVTGTVEDIAAPVVETALVAEPVIRTIDEAIPPAVDGTVAAIPMATQAESDGQEAGSAGDVAAAAVSDRSTEGSGGVFAMSGVVDDAQMARSDAAAAAVLSAEVGQVVFVSRASSGATAVRADPSVPTPNGLRRAETGAPMRTPTPLTSAAGAVGLAPPATPTAGSGSGGSLAAFLRYRPSADADGLRTRIAVLEAAWTSVTSAPSSLPG